MACNRIESSKYVNFQAGRCGLTVIAECKKVATATPLFTDLSVGDKALFFTEISAPNEGISLPLGTMKSAMRALNRGANTSGDINGTTTGDEEITEKTGTFTYREDFSYFTDSEESVAQYKSVLENQFLARTFNDGVGTNGSVWKVVGTMGNKKEGGCVTAGGDWEALFYRDNKLISPQDYDTVTKTPRLVTNFDLEALQRNTLTSVMEFKTNYAGEIDKSIRFTGCVFSNPIWNEAGDFNTIAVDYNLPCDARVGSDFFVNEIPSAKPTIGGYVDLTDVVFGTSASAGEVAIDEDFSVDISATACHSDKALSVALDMSSPVTGALLGVINTGVLVGYLSIYDDSGTKKVTQYSETDATTIATAVSSGKMYRIVTIGTTDWTVPGATNGTVGEVFIAGATPATGDGTAYEITNQDFVIQMAKFSFDDEKYIPINSTNGGV